MIGVMRLRRAVVIGAAMLTLGACGEDEAADSTAASGAGNTTAAEGTMNCRRDLPPPPLEGQGEGNLALILENFGYEFVEGRHRYPHIRRFRETGGVPVTIYRGKVCVADGTECVDACVSYRVAGGSSLVQADHHVATTQASDRITLHYWARDDAGNLFEMAHTLETDGKTARVVE
jgi:hypothetical protein